MNIIRLLIAAALFFSAYNAKAQVTLTANDATNKKAGWTLSLQTPKNIAAWQMKITLPEGITIPSHKETVGNAEFNVYDVKLPARYGSKYKATGIPTEDGSILLFFTPLTATPTAEDFDITGTEGEACTITLKATKFEGPATCTITNICASDADAISIQGADMNVNVNHPAGDASKDFVVNGSDIQTIINNIVARTYDESSDVYPDNKVNGADIQSVINIIIN